ncbi:ABC transporter ATP-binding protein [Neobacillus terrae]|uniref:ABC transporter ATP-binding protein n=1 Tax=Neobacillus terrae TaxID=3034837 RepID=UPI00140AF25E|nr:ABC transporter ATP-binding protein [Neobacillus terrae]NHM31167.1 ABC transporter ATP-binding protein [Neobacillus terrae]
MNAFIKADKVSKNFGAHKVLKEVSFKVDKGKVVGLLGPNGAGKTTIIRLLNGVIIADGGSMEIGGWNPRVNGHEIRKMCGILTDGAGMYFEMSGAENLEFFAKIYGTYEKKRIQTLLEEFELAEHQKKKVGLYSTGMKKRLGMIKALLHRPQILFLDEPTNGLDPEGIRLVYDYVSRLNHEEGTTIFLCSHILHQLEDVCHSFMFLENGSILESGTKQELEEKYINQVTLRVETGLNIKSDLWNGLQVKNLGVKGFEFKLSNKGEIAPLLQKIAEESWIHDVHIQNRDLESLYFKIRGESNE